MNGVNAEQVHGREKEREWKKENAGSLEKIVFFTSELFLDRPKNGRPIPGMACVLQRLPGRHRTILYGKKDTILGK